MKRIIFMLAGMSVIATAGWCSEEESENHGKEHHYHKHHVAVFLGNTHDYHGEDAFTVGVDYEYRLHEYFGIGALIDHAGESINSTILGGGVFIHPWKNLRLLTALGNEHQSGHNIFLVRLGAMYDFRIKGWILSPTVNVDLLEGGHQNLVYGFAVGRGF